MVAYMISDGKGSYIRKDFSGKYTTVRNVVLADTWDDRNKARNILNNQINKKIRSRCKIIEASAESPKKSKIGVNSTGNAQETINGGKEDDELDKWEQGLSSFNDFVLDMEERKEKLSEDLSNIDKEITDIQHYIEFGKFNAYQGWLAFNMLRHRLKKRRKIKNELQVLMQISDSKINSSTLISIQDAIHKLDEKVYKPRVLTELFN